MAKRKKTRKPAAKRRTKRAKRRTVKRRARRAAPKRQGIITETLELRRKLEGRNTFED